MDHSYDQVSMNIASRLVLIVTLRGTLGTGRTGLPCIAIGMEAP